MVDASFKIFFNRLKRGKKEKTVKCFSRIFFFDDSKHGMSDRQYP